MKKSILYKIGGTQNHALPLTSAEKLTSFSEQMYNTLPTGQ